MTTHAAPPGVALTSARDEAKRPNPGHALPARWFGHALRTLRLLGTVALGALALLLIAAVAPNLAGHHTLLIKSGSMGQAVPVGSLVVTRSIPAEQVRVGTIVLIGTPGQGSDPVLHRVVERSEASDGATITVRTKGDANTAADSDPYVLPDEVLTPAYVIPRIGFAVAAVTTPTGWFLLVVAPGSVLLALFIVDTWSPPATPNSFCRTRRRGRHCPEHALP